MSPGRVVADLPSSDDVPNVNNTENSTALLIAVTRLEAKLDVALAQHGAKIEDHDETLTDHETRLRAQEARPSPPPDHETRIRTVEARRTVSPKALWTAIGSGAATILAVLSIIERFPAYP